MGYLAGGAGLEGSQAKKKTAAFYLDYTDKDSGSAAEALELTVRTNYHQKIEQEHMHSSFF